MFLRLKILTVQCEFRASSNVKKLGGIWDWARGGKNWFGAKMQIWILGCPFI